MTGEFPSACPEVHASDIVAATGYYRDALGFTIDWLDAKLGLGGMSRGETRLFIASKDFRAHFGNGGRTLTWFNLSSRAEIDALHAEWKGKGARLWGPPEAKPHKLYEFFAEDLDGNILRVFYDFSWEERETEKQD